MKHRDERSLSSSIVRENKSEKKYDVRRESEVRDTYFRRENEGSGVRETYFRRENEEIQRLNRQLNE